MTTDLERGWQPDPDDPARERWWDGAAYTSLSRSITGAEDKADPPPPPPPPPPAAVAAATPVPPVGDSAAFDRAPWPAAVTTAGAATAVGAAIAAPPVGGPAPAPPPPPPAKSKWKIPALIAAILLLALIGGVIAYSAGRSDGTDTATSEPKDKGTKDTTETTKTTDKDSGDSETKLTTAPTSKTVAPTTKQQVVDTAAPTVQTLQTLPPATNAPGLSGLPSAVPSDVVRNLPMESWVTILQSGPLSAATTMGDVTGAEARANGAGYTAAMLYTNDYPSLRQNILAAYVGPFGSCVEARTMAERLIASGLGFTEDSTYQRKISTDPAFQNPEMTKC